LGFLLGVLVATALVAAYSMFSSRPAPPQAGAPPPVAIADSARPLAQPEAPAPKASPAAVETPAVTTTAVPPVGTPPATIARSQPSLYVWPAPASAPANATAAPVESQRSAPEPAPAPLVVTEPAAAPGPAITESFETQRSAEFHVSPEEAIVTIDGVTIGKADDWDGMGGGKAWVFNGPGTYLVKLEADGYRTTWIRIVVRPGAEESVVDVDTDLEESQ
jgi:hypothetical protein